MNSYPQSQKLELTDHVGNIILSPFPAGGNVLEYNDFVKAISTHVGLVITLVTEQEWHRYSGDRLEQELISHNIQWIHAPIKDYGVPDKVFESSWKNIISQMKEVLAQKDVLIHCVAGCGRTGMVAALFLQECGQAPEQSIHHIRSIRSCSIETPEQELFVLGKTRDSN